VGKYRPRTFATGRVLSICPDPTKVDWRGRISNTRQSRAVWAMQATYHWSLTGTPVTNSLSDREYFTSELEYLCADLLPVYPLLRFMRLRPFYDWKDFREKGKIKRRRIHIAPADDLVGQSR
jgi:hypothetical protein